MSCSDVLEKKIKFEKFNCDICGKGINIVDGRADVR